MQFVDVIDTCISEVFLFVCVCVCVCVRTNLCNWYLLQQYKYVIDTRNENLINKFSMYHFLRTLAHTHASAHTYTH